MSTSLARFLQTLEGELAALRQDATGLASDLAGLQGELAGLASDLANPQGTLDAMLAHLARGPAAYVGGIQAALASLASGLTLAGLQQALTAGPSIFLQSLQSAIAEVTQKIAGIQARIASVVQRIAGIEARIAALAARIAALDASRLLVVGWRNTLLAEVAMYRFEGPANQLGTELDGEVGSLAPTSAAAVVLVATAPSAVVALGSVFA